jgi:import inner membrane translocase subunit TIM44
VKEAAEKYKKASEEFNKAADPLKKNPVVGKVSESFQTILKDESGRYGGFVDKETRRKLREESMKAEGHHKAKPVSENPEAGASMVIHKDSAWKESWNKFKEESSFMQGRFRKPLVLFNCVVFNVMFYRRFQCSQEIRRF